MGHDLEVSTDDLREVANNLLGLAREFSSAWTSFSSLVHGFGDIFGRDKTGDIIGTSYQAAHALADHTFISAANALTDFANGLSKMASQYESAEEDNRTDMTALEV